MKLNEKQVMVIQVPQVERRAGDRVRGLDEERTSPEPAVEDGDLQLEGRPLSDVLLCGCCGARFRPWPGCEDVGDRFGTCATCQREVDTRLRKEMDGAIARLATALSGADRARFIAADRRTQEAVVRRCFEAKIAPSP